MLNLGLSQKLSLITLLLVRRSQLPRISASWSPRVKKMFLLNSMRHGVDIAKKLTPIYDELGEKMAEEDVEIVKMDATANDVPPEFDVKGFPTLFWLPKGTKKPVSYNGGRELD